jgi:3-deoxy-D-manno-octulosonic-acid transferase
MGRYTQSCQSVVDKLSEVGALYQPQNPCYRPVTVEKLAANVIAIDEQVAIHDKAHIKQAPPGKQSAANNDDKTRIYQQLAFWLSHLELAKQAGHTGEQMTKQQQAVLTRQLAMITSVIEQYSHAETL